ncbi:hypothetical protein ASPFODRAFT_49267 [Aspergillus luchuensis CBS 106.47]|uniref:Uncharacterized protein n=1 Tax=Aspergillus luchuensis (strain CBS 106.47) TaxID=1137211 RepID=A0A1M3TAN5_ASPLC|nr:hypothetical protein ASPFODRAFT_49267 [Aspergillus luchuensis CBS 106.47]
MRLPTPISNLSPNHSLGADSSGRHDIYITDPLIAVCPSADVPLGICVTIMVCMSFLLTFLQNLMPFAFFCPFVLVDGPHCFFGLLLYPSIAHVHSSVSWGTCM